MSDNKKNYSAPQNKQKEIKKVKNVASIEEARPLEPLSKDHGVVETTHGNEVEVDYSKLESYLQFKATREMCAYMLGISESTLKRKVKERYDMTFSDLQQKCLAPMKVQLVNKALSMALKGDRVLLIFCLKNYCGWSDKNTSDEQNVNNFIQLNYKL